VITQLYIRNYAIIREIDIHFKTGLTILTGETGAGKSIIVGALSLILGERADSQAMLNSQEKCIIEGRFNISQLENVQQYLVDNDFDQHDELIIRREIVSNGKSRIFINDTPATLSLLAPLSGLLIDLHRQFDTIDLQQNTHQLSILDEIAGLQSKLKDYAHFFTEWKKSVAQYNLLCERNKQIKSEADYNHFLYEELEKINFSEDEIEQSDIELDRLNNSEALKAGLQKNIYLLNESDEPILAQLKSIIQTIEPFSKSIPELHELIVRIQSCTIELKDICNELEDQCEKTSYDEERIMQLNERISEGNRLFKKHHVNTTNELIAIQKELELKISSAASADTEEEVLKNRIESELNHLIKLAEEISNERTLSIPTIEKTVNGILKKVGMPNAHLKIAQNTVELNQYGKDKIEFLIDANKTGKYQSIAKAASGGELSRLMLCIKSLQASSTHMPTLIFDEIDTGISGETAIQVGQIMKALSINHQLICITHLPQIASKANQHVYIYKEENQQGEINTRMKELNDDERINILAEMLGGKEPNMEAKQMIKQLMK
jgi:DNA repair protein RecN (Recombination protein N)